MKEFRFVILGAAKIAVKFCDAVRRIEGCRVAAVASKSKERARAFAEANDVPAFYDSYEEMLIAEKPDAAYVCTTPHDHYRLSMLCLKHGIPVLCEKSMFLTSADARSLFAESDRKGLFVMEAMWSRFLPAMITARDWLRSGRIGDPVFAELGLGFKAAHDAGNRYFNPAIGGGTAYDIVCYGWELSTWTLERRILSTSVTAAKAWTGVDASTVVTLKLEGEIPVVIKSSFMTYLQDALTVYGSEGRIVVPTPNFAAETILYDLDGNEVGHFRDETTENGFVYEINETMRCIREGRTESDVVPHRDTVACSEVFDLILKELGTQP